VCLAPPTLIVLAIVYATCEYKIDTAFAEVPADEIAYRASPP
jgi:hypothetical protein